MSVLQGVIEFDQAVLAFHLGQKVRKLTGVDHAVLVSVHCVNHVVHDKIGWIVANSNAQHASYIVSRQESLVILVQVVKGVALVDNLVPHFLTKVSCNDIDGRQKVVTTGKDSLFLQFGTMVHERLDFAKSLHEVAGHGDSEHVILSARMKAETIKLGIYLQVALARDGVITR